ncbi:hypothetical protein [Flammeovirga sp. OC4]|uniref:hypothetical protein n=1 Tax=Flammeovirga sp. OC4 TaxID=1382345 RepID=UPI0005C45ADD|nr:hypothetical protein [Flammeovirga sp. OC4]
MKSRKILTFFLIIILGSCFHSNEPTVNKILEAKDNYPKLATSFEDLHRLNRDFITEKFEHDFCDGKFEYLVDIGKFKNLHLILMHKNICCLCIPFRNSFHILVNKKGEYLSDNKIVRDVKEISTQISKYLISNGQKYNFIQIQYDSTCSEKVLVEAIEQVGKGYKNYLLHSLNSSNSIENLKREKPLKLMIVGN